MPSTDYYHSVVDLNIENGSSRNTAHPIQPNPDSSLLHSEDCRENHDSSAMTFSKSNSDIKKDKESSCGGEEKPKTRIDFGEHFPDGGWGWVVTVAAAVVYLLCNGVHHAFGILYLAIQKEKKKMKISDIQTGRNIFVERLLFLFFSFFYFNFFLYMKISISSLFFITNNQLPALPDKTETL